MVVVQPYVHLRNDIENSLTIEGWVVLYHALRKGNNADLLSTFALTEDDLYCLIEDSVKKCFHKEHSKYLYISTPIDELFQYLRQILFKSIMTFDVYRAADNGNSFFTYFYGLLLNFRKEFAQKDKHKNHYDVYFPTYLESKNLVIDADLLSSIDSENDNFDWFDCLGISDDVDITELVFAVSQSNLLSTVEKNILNVIVAEDDSIRCIAKSGKYKVDWKKVSELTGISIRSIKQIIERIPYKLIDAGLVSNSFELELESCYSIVDDRFMELDDLLEVALPLDDVLERVVERETSMSLTA